MDVLSKKSIHALEKTKQVLQKENQIKIILAQASCRLKKSLRTRHNTIITKSKPSNKFAGLPERLRGKT